MCGAWESAALVVEGIVEEALLATLICVVGICFFEN